MYVVWRSSSNIKFNGEVFDFNHGVVKWNEFKSGELSISVEHNIDSSNFDVDNISSIDILEALFCEPRNFIDGEFLKLKIVEVSLFFNSDIEGLICQFVLSQHWDEGLENVVNGSSVN